MNNSEFIKKIQEVQLLMKDEKYQEALIILDKLKEIEKAGNLDYSLTHKLYQLISNSHSLYNQQILLKVIQKESSQQESISFTELKEILTECENIDIDEPILRREVEILILRSLLSCKIEGDELVF
ncbi:hypothetical protein ES705_16457 [subsurface metagenome]